MITESDVEQKLIFGLLTKPSPEGFGYFFDDIQTKPNIRNFSIDKGNSRKLYYPDYVIVLEGLPTMIVEAKTPADDNLEEAYREARLYAAELNALYGPGVNPCSKILATNGIRLLAGHSDSDVFAADVSINQNLITDSAFVDVLQLASRNELLAEAKAVRSKLRGNANYTKPVFTLGGKTVINQTVGQNGFGANVSLEYKSLFNPETVAEKKDIVNNAYVPSKRRQSHVGSIDRIIRATIPPHQRDAQIVENSEKPVELFKAFRSSASLKNELCLLIGGVGAGKSTFTEFLRTKALPAEITRSTTWLHVNLNNAPLAKKEIYNWTVREITTQIKKDNEGTDFDSLDFLKSLYKEELDAASKGRAALFPKDSVQHLEVISEELAKHQNDEVYTLQKLVSLFYENKGILLTIVLDNCDKRTRDDQLLMFEVASWLKNSFSCLIFLPIRDTTYDQFSDQPPLDTVIKDLVFRIEAPLLERVLTERMKYLLRTVEGQNPAFRFSVENGMMVSTSRSDVINFMRCVITSLFQQQTFKSIVKGLAGRNIRRGLEIVLDFCKSGHISTDQIVKMRASGGDYRLPHYLVYKVLLKGDRKYFSDEKSRLLNIFHSSPEDDLPDPFVRMDILNWLRRNFNVKGPNNTKGFHKVGALLKSAQAFGHSRDRIIEEIQTLVDAELIMSEGQTTSVELDDLVCITAAGFTHLNIVKSVDYLSTVAEDTQFRDSAIASSIADNIVGRGVFKSDSKEAVLSSSMILTKYLMDYSEKFFINNEALSDAGDWDHRSHLKELMSALELKTATTGDFDTLSSIEADYPPKSVHLGQVVAIQNYGIFVELSTGVTCMVHKSQFGTLPHKVFDKIEEGDEVMIEIMAFSRENKRLSGRLSLFE